MNFLRAFWHSNFATGIITCRGISARQQLLALPARQKQDPTAMRNLLQLLPVLFLCVSSLRAEGPAWWPQWRGPSGQGYATDSKVPLEWSATKNLLWKLKLPGAGHSTPIIWGDRIFLTCANDKLGTMRYVVCIGTDGKPKWQREIKAEGGQVHSATAHATASCATDGKRVYAFFGTPGLFCYDLDGKLLWQHRFGIFTCSVSPNWGVGASPLLFEDLVIQNCDTDGADHLPPGHARTEAAPSHLVALNRETGDVVWSTPRDQGRGFSTPVLITTPAGRADLVLNGPQGVWAYDPKTGKELWHCYRHPDQDQNKFGEPLPLFANGMIYTAAGRETGYLQAMKMDGAGDISKTGLAWEVRRKNIRDVGSGILVGDYLLYADGRDGAISTHDIKNGNQNSEKTKGGRQGNAFYSSPILLNGNILCLRQDGRMFVLEPGPEIKIVRENVLSDGTLFNASPAVADGKLYVRSQTHLYCIGTR
jgi:outer membrane protein assembly factor BamB